MWRHVTCRERRDKSCAEEEGTHDADGEVTRG
jgi:hypothetical protein